VSAIFKGYGTMHFVTEERRDVQPPELRWTRVSAPCGVIRIFKRGERWVEDGHPTCMRCALKLEPSYITLVNVPE
jgi:hypothetical protein